MAATNPRIPVLLTPHQHDVLKRLAKTQGTSVSKIVGEIVQTVFPPLERALALAEAAQRASDAVKERLAESAGQAEQALLPIVTEGLSRMERLEAELDGIAMAVKASGDGGHAQRGSRRRTPSPTRRPPTVNKGVTTPKTRIKPRKGVR